MIQPQLAAGGQLAKERHFIRFRLVDNDVLRIHDGVAKLAPQFRLSRRAMHAGGDQNGDLRLRVALANLAKEQRHGDSAGYRTGVIAGDNENLFLPLHLFTQAHVADRILQCLLNDFFLRRMRLLRMIGREYRRKARIIDMKRLRAAPIRDRNLRHG